MIIIYTTPSCSSCRKAKKWFDDHLVEYVERNLFTQKLSSDDIDYILRNAENGFDDIISTRSKVFKEEKLDIEDMLMSELKDFIIENPSVLKRPIIVDDDRLQVGYNEEEIRIFIPKRLRELIMGTNYTIGGDLEYEDALKIYYAEMKEKGIERK